MPLGEGGKRDHGGKSTGWGVGGWVFTICQLLTLGLGFHNLEAMVPTSLRVRVNNIMWGDTCGQSVLHAGMASNACGFSSLPKAWNAPGCGYTRCLEPETVLSLSQRHLGLVEGGEHVVFQAYGVACLPPWQAKAGAPKGTSRLHAIV